MARTKFVPGDWVELKDFGLPWNLGAYQSALGYVKHLDRDNYDRVIYVVHFFLPMNEERTGAVHRPYVYSCQCKHRIGVRHLQHASKEKLESPELMYAAFAEHLGVGIPQQNVASTLKEPDFKYFDPCTE